MNKEIKKRIPKKQAVSLLMIMGGSAKSAEHSLFVSLHDNVPWYGSDGVKVGAERRNKRIAYFVQGYDFQVKTALGRIGLRSK